MKVHRVFRTKEMILIVGSILVVMVVAAFMFRMMANRSAAPIPYIPQSLSEELLFTPYIPSWLPDGYKVDAASYSVEGQALVFSAVKSGSESITISEQATPKDFDMNGFLTSNVTDATRLDGANYPAVFGKMNGRKQNLTSITIDTTWILVTVPESMTKDNVKPIVSGLIRQ